MAAPQSSDARTALRHALIGFVVVAVAVAALVKLDYTLPVIGNVGSALVAVALLYAPVVIAWRRKEDLAGYGFTLEPLGRGLAFGLTVPLIILPLFVAGYVAFLTIVCRSDALDALALPGVCARFAGLAGLSLPTLDRDVAEFALIQLIVVALPEELFFRGCLLHLLEQALPPRRRLLGGGVGVALVLSAVLFALIHVPRDGDPRALATFFPGLLFGWMRSATGSILAPTLAHASSNVLVHVLDRMVLR